MIHRPSAASTSFRTIERFLSLLFSQLTLIAAAILLPLTYLVISSVIEFESGKWTLRVHTPPLLGFASVYLATDDGFVRLPYSETITDSSGNFCTIYNFPSLKKADLHVLVSSDNHAPQTVRLFAQFVSKDGHASIDLPPASIATYSSKQFDLEFKTDPLAPRHLPKLTATPVTLPPTRQAVMLYWLLCTGCAAVGSLFYVSAQRGSGQTWIAHMTRSRFALRCKKNVVQNLLLTLTSLNIILFVGVSILFTQRYPVADDSMMAMIANGMLGANPSEHLIFIHVIIGLLLKTLCSNIPSIPWYDLFTAIALIASSAIIGFCLIKRLGLRLGGITYTIVFLFFIFQFFYQLQFTTTAALLCLAGLSVALSTTPESGFKKPTLWLAVMLMLLGSLVRYDAALLIIALAMPALLIQAIQSRRATILVFLLLSLGGIIVLKQIDRVYYSTSPDWKFYSDYNVQRGHLHGMAKFRNFTDNSSSYSAIGWDENDFLMISHNWLYQDLKVYSEKNLTYLTAHLEPKHDILTAFFAFLQPSSLYPWMTFAVLACLLYLWMLCALRLLLALSIATVLLAILCYLAWASHLPNHVFIPAMLGGFLLTVFLADNHAAARKNHFLTAYCLFLGLFFLSFSFIFNEEASGRDARRTAELNKSLDKISFLKNKVFQISITSIRYEDFPPFENYTRLRKFHFIDGLWTYPSPDTLSAYHQYGIEHPLLDLARKDNFYLLVPTFSGSRGYEVQTFLREHYGMIADYDVVKDPEGNSCCYPAFTVLKFHPATFPPSSMDSSPHQAH